MLKGLTIMYLKRSVGMGVLGVPLFGFYGAKSCFESAQSHKNEEQRHKQGLQKTGTEDVGKMECGCKPAPETVGQRMEALRSSCSLTGEMCPYHRGFSGLKGISIFTAQHAPRPVLT